MVTESAVNMPSTLRGGSYEDLEVDIDALLREHNHQQQPRGSSSVDRLRELSVSRSGSAPPTVEGSMSALRSMLGAIDDPRAIPTEEEEVEDEVRSHPAYLAYYYSNENTNPRLPPPAVSREDWRATQRLRSSFGGIGDQRKKGMVVANGDGDGGGSRSLFPLPTGGASSRENEVAEGTFTRNSDVARRDSVDWANGSPLTGPGLRSRKKSFVDVLQEDLGHPSVTASQNAFNGALDPVGMLDSSLENVGIHSNLSSPALNKVHSIGSSVSPSLSSGCGVPPLRSRTPDPKLIQRVPSPGLPLYSARSNLSSDAAPHLLGDSDIAAALSGIDLSNARFAGGEDHTGAPICREFSKPNDFLLNLPDDRSQYAQQNIRKPEIETLDFSSLSIEAYNNLIKNGLLDQSYSKISSNGHAKLQRNLSSGCIGNKVPPLGSDGVEGSSMPYNKAELTDRNFSGNNLLGFSTNQLSEERLSNCFVSGANSGSGLEGQYPNRSGSQAGSTLQAPLNSPYLQRAGVAAQAASMLNDSSLARNSEASFLDMTGYQKAYLEALLAQQKLQYGMPFLGNPVGLDHSPYANSTYGLGLPYSARHVSSSILSSLGNGSSSRQKSERLPRFPSIGRTQAVGSLGSWTSENETKDSGFSSSFLEEFKNNKTKNFELSDIVGHVVEFSADQYGSRFIQQKLETASTEEKDLIFPEILPHARALMTDVFGNYVIQKFFEHGTETQRMQLASQLKDHVLPLSLQMYGCRVIQKALEVVDVGQQTEMVSELDGSIMKCVRDQNGNHVIQKCIECVPQEKIQFIISTFYGQVVTLSTHPYGCRVIQRILEHCDDAKTLNIMMEEILKSVSTLAQDQYGNYVVQHVLQHGKSEERSAIISTLAGQIIKMSQQKFASNVVEKCLTYGTAEERQILINEMLGSTDENEPLQAMMKDQFGNYVVQKVLETCDDQNRELILSRIKEHLNALKRYTYGKHIVARVEKLVAAGERRVGALSSCP